MSLAESAVAPIANNTLGLITMRKPESDTSDPKRPDQRHAPLRTAARAVWLLVSWGVCLALLLASGAWLYPGAGWRIDLVANLTAQIGVAALALAICFSALRAWGRTLVMILALALASFALAPNRAGSGSSPDGGVVRLLTFNSYNSDHVGEAAAAIIEAADVDVFTIIEPTPEIIRLLNDSESFRERYPYSIPRRPYAARPTIVSRWPLEILDFRYGAVEEGMPRLGISPTGGVVQRPEGAFVVAATHPPSPRSAEAWEGGNEGMRRLAARVVEVAASHGLPIVVGGDFNSTPTGWRSRQFQDTTGLLRGKPWMAVTGTWPSGLPWPAKLAIDDVFVSPSIGVASWRTFEQPHGGDHAPVQIGLVIPASAGTTQVDAPDQSGKDDAAGVDGASEQPPG